MKSLFIVTLLSALFLTGNVWAQSPGPADAYIQLANLAGWRIIEENRVDLKAPSKNYGTWDRKVLTFEDTNRSLEVNIFSGAGPGTLYLPDVEISDNDRPIGSGATYKTVVIKGHRGILEVYPYIGKALTIRIAQDITLCLESKTLTAKELRDTAAAMITERTFSAVKEN